MTDVLTIEVDGGKTEYCPAETIAGVVRWQLAHTPDSGRVRLTYVVCSRGTETEHVIAEADIENLPSELPTEVCSGAPYRGRLQPDGLKNPDIRRFQFTLPQSPHTFSGKLISVSWVLAAEIGADPLTDRAVFSMLPSDGLFEEL